jgi:hypothetical protein
MKKRIVFVAAVLFTAGSIVAAFSYRTVLAPKVKRMTSTVETPVADDPKGCVYNTIMGLEDSEGHSKFKTPDRVKSATDKGLAWITKAQQQHGGWGAGSHSAQHVMDPHAVPADPATTSMVAMSILRSGSTLDEGEYSIPLKKATHWLLGQVEKSDPNDLNITTETGTQIQSKLGQNIDVVLTSQFLSNLLEKIPEDHAMRERIESGLDVCVYKIQKGQNANGSTKGSGWAGVLQSSLATNALESAKYNGADVDDLKLDNARKYQKDNYDAESGNVSTADGAGIVLYSVSGSVRASAKQAREVEEKVKEAKTKGLVDKAAEVTADLLEEIGLSNEDARELERSYKVYNSAKQKAQQQDVISGFGNNGGEEFLSYLQTGESLVINKDDDWMKWFDDTSGRLLSIQNSNGSWNGHHCITSPVFCTATCLLILSVENDVDNLQAIGSVN